jgi:phosphatidylserine/phosphatidylglycerophosphate/cardiolipin synthase-like enzyme
MLRRSALPFAAVSLATVLLAGAGCKVQVPSAAASSGTSGAVAAGTSGVTRVGSLIVEASAGFSPVYDLIDRARHSIDVTMYEFSDTTAERDLAAATRRGVRKVVEADYGTAHPKVFIGSENFSNTSLNDNRELGLIISSHAVMSAIASTFATDFRNGQRWS